MVERARDSVAVSPAYRVLAGLAGCPGHRFECGCVLPRSANMKCTNQNEPGARGAGQRSPVMSAGAGPCEEPMSPAGQRECPDPGA
eukprot:10093083-Alexandrium_andersonii.AAC.1